MQDKLKDILSHLSTEVDQETLLLYLQGKLSPEKQHDLEKQMMENEFAADALEGLQQFENKEHISTLTSQLNKELKKKTAQKRKRKIQRIQAEPWLIITLLIILLLIVFSYFIIYLYFK